MMIRGSGFNLYLLLAAGLALLCGCQSAESKRKKIVATFRLHQEMNPDATERTATVEIFRARPFNLSIDKVYFLSESMVKEAKVVDAIGGFALQIQFDRRGTWLLEQYTAAMRGKHFAVFSQFVSPGEEKLNQGRWLSAPLVQTRITDGLLVFTPDANRQEADQIALGLNNVAKKLKTGDEWPGRGSGAAK